MGLPKKRIDEAGRGNTLGLSKTKLDTLLDRLDAEGQKSVVRRDNARWPFRQPSIGVTLVHPGGSQVEVQMACRNLSRGGAALLHSSFLYNGTRCVFALPHAERGPVPVQGEVVRCQHREGVIHEIGIKFDDEIDLRSFANPNPLLQLFSAERVEASELEGTLLHVEHTEHERHLLKHFLKDTSVRVLSATTAREGLEIAQKGVDMVISEFTLEDMPGSEFVVQLRSENCSAPFVFLTHDVGDRVVNTVKRRLAQAMIRKPLTEETLLAALSEFLTPGSGSDLPTAQAIDPELIDSLKPEIARCARQIAEGMRSNTPIDVVGACHVLRQISGVIGMNRLSDDVAGVIVRLSAEMELGVVSDELRLIVEQCRRAA